MRLYGIKKSELEQALNYPDRRVEIENHRRVAVKNIPGRFGGFPLKVVYIVESKDTIVISTYPFERIY